jgi:molybdenum cofactor synthesis domain-containing protein
MVERLRKIGFSKLTSVEDALNLLFSKVQSTRTKEIETSKALHRVLAQNIESQIDVPSFDRAAMDGYAVVGKDTFGASPKNPKSIKKTGKIEIGEVSDLSMESGEGIRISTGAAIPSGADAVVKIEYTEIDENDQITIYNPVAPGKNVSKRGEDVKKGELILEKGTELKPEHLALLASQGIAKVQVKEKPDVSVFSTGDELVEVGNPLKRNQIYNSNTPMISNLARVYGGNIVIEDTLKDDKSLITERLKEAIELSDIVIFTGGTSVGTQDYLPEVVKENASVLVHGIAMRPGSPVLLAHKDGTLIFCLPGTPVAAYVGFLKFAGPALRKMMDAKNLDPRKDLIAVMNKDIPVSRMGYLNFLRVSLERKENKIIAESVRLKGSGVISSLTEADGIVEISKEREGLKEGEKVVVKLFPW